MIESGGAIVAPTVNSRRDGPRPLNLLAVWVAGIGWRGGEYEVVVVDEQGHAMVGPTVFGG